MARMMRVTGNSATQVVRLEGKRSRPEPSEFRLEFPGGYIYILRFDQPDGKRPEWWIHTGVFHPDHPDRHRTANLDKHGDPGITAKIIDGRVDCYDKGAAETILLADEHGVDHVAIRIQETERTGR